MSSIRTKIIYFLLPVSLLGVGIILVGSVKNDDNSALAGLATQATTVSLDPPNDLNFAGEIVPLHDFDVKERLDKELIRYIYYHSATIMNIKRAARWKPEMQRILKEEGVPQDFFYLCVAESHLQNAKSPVGALGFWQFMKGTAPSYGLEISDQVDERLDPIKATYAACKYLKDGYRMFKNWTLVAASYNMGMGGVRGQLRKQKVDNYYDLYLNRETAAYVFRILAIKTILSAPEDYGFELKKNQLYRPLRYKTVKVDSTIDDLITFALDHGTTYKMMKVLNPWILKDRLEIPQAKEGEEQKIYEIKVPRDAKFPELEDAKELIPDSADIGVQPVDSTKAQDDPAPEKVDTPADSAQPNTPQPDPRPTPPADSAAKDAEQNQ
ncbi:MAG: lytic transglycosylase domain-containing protein [Bacteroidota bacterium]